MSAQETPEITIDEQDTAWLEPLVEFVLAKMYVHPDTEVSINFVDEAEMERLHLDWMDLPGATDVMSFPMDELRPGTPENLAGPGLLGDVVVCLPVALDQAENAGHSLKEEVQLLVTHSLLHLLGYDHHTPADEAEMFGLQKQLLVEFAGQQSGKPAKPAEQESGESAGFAGHFACEIAGEESL